MLDIALSIVRHDPPYLDTAHPNQCSANKKASRRLPLIVGQDLSFEVVVDHWCLLEIDGHGWA